MLNWGLELGCNFADKDCSVLDWFFGEGMEHIAEFRVKIGQGVPLCVGGWFSTSKTV